MRIRARPVSSDERGQAALELLMIFPVFIVVVLLAVDFGVWMYESVSVSTAVREGARYAAVNCPSDGGCSSVDIIKDYTASKSSGSLVSDDVHVSWVTRGSFAAGAKGSSVVVAACKEYKMLFLPVTFTTGLTSSTDMRLEQTSASSSGGSTC